MSRVKGTTIAGRLSFARKHGGDDAVAALMNAISDRATADELRLTGPLKSSWYPFQTYIELTEALDKRFGKGDGSLISQISGDVAENDLKTVYKIFFKLASPLYIVNKCAQVFRQYYDSGEMKVEEEREGFARIRLTNFDTPHKTHCLAILGWMDRTLHLTGVKAPKARHERCRVTGAQACDFVLEWQP